MRVVLVAPEPTWRGGVAAHSLGLRRALLAGGHDTTTIAYSRCYPRFLMRLLGRGPQPVADGAVLDALAPASWHKTRALVESLDPELIVGQWWHPITAPALTTVLGARLPLPRTDPVTVLLCHNVLPHEPFPLARRLARRALGSVDGLLVHSDAVAGQLRLLLAPSCPPIEMCSMPLLLRPDISRTDRARCRRTLGLGSEERLVLFVGHGRHYKGLDILLRAWGQSGLAGEARLLVAGEVLARRSWRRHLTRSARMNSVLLYDRYLDDTELLEFLAAADLLVLPYRRASQSGILPVARALGLPVVASNTGGLAEQMLPGMEADELCRPGDVAALVLALRRSLGRASGLDW